MKHNNALKLDLGLLCQVVGRRLGVEVVEQKGLTTFATNGKQVLIPRNIAGGEIDADIMRGGIAHEAAGHVQHADFGALGKFMEEMLRTRPRSAEFAKALQNVIEDARIEQAAIRKFPGCRKILGKMIEALESRGFFGLPQPDNAPGVLISWLIRKLRQDILKQPISTEAMDAMAEEGFGKDVLANIYRVAEAGARGESTEDVLASARAILTILGDAAEPPQQKPQDDDGKGDSQQSPAQLQRAIFDTLQRVV